MSEENLNPDGKYRQMIQMAGDAIYVIDAESATVLEANIKAEELTGYSAKEIVGLKVWELHPSDEYDHAKKLFERVVATGTGESCLMSLQRSDGGTARVEVLASVIEYGGKKLIQRICRDISRRLELESENAHLRDFYESILDMMPVGLGVRLDIDSNNPIVEFENMKLKEMFEREIREGCGCDWHEIGKREDVEVNPILNENGTYAEEVILPNQKVYEFTTAYFRGPADSWREIRIVRDITERKRLLEQIAQAKENLERKVEERTRELKEKHAQLVQSEKMATLGNLVAGVAHEINTPLGALRSNTDLFVRSLNKLRALLDDADLPPKTREIENLRKLLEATEKLNEVNREASERIVTIVNSLRKFARLDQAEMDRVDIHEGLESTLTLVHHETRGRIEVVREYGDIPPVECYPNQLNQVFMNILVNAVQAIDDEGTIRIRTYTEDDNAVIEISDTGRGIPEDVLHRVFDPGFTTKGSGIGTGLGLAIVHQIIRDHNGRIEVETEPGEGSTFKIVVPIDRP